ncbi:MAG: hypothetical protein IKA05_08795 [Clostridia bacterium]|nr:hypothetical protein [Clostridia bacterium]
MRNTKQHGKCAAKEKKKTNGRNGCLENGIGNPANKTQDGTVFRTLKSGTAKTELPGMMPVFRIAQSSKRPLPKMPFQAGGGITEPLYSYTFCKKIPNRSRNLLRIE